MIEVNVDPVIWYVVAHQMSIMIALSVLFAMSLFGAVFGKQIFHKRESYKKLFTAGTLIFAVLLVSFIFIQGDLNNTIQKNVTNAIGESIGLKDVKLSKISENSGVNPSIGYFGIGLDGDGEVRQFEIEQYGQHATIHEIGADSFESSKKIEEFKIFD